MSAFPSSLRLYPAQNGQDDRLRIAVLAPPWIAVPPPGYGGIEAVVDLLCGGWLTASNTPARAEEKIANLADRQWPAVTSGGNRQLSSRSTRSWIGRVPMVEVRFRRSLRRGGSSDPLARAAAPHAAGAGRGRAGHGRPVCRG
jgi:hypothetical protein